MPCCDINNHVSPFLRPPALSRITDVGLLVRAKVALVHLEQGALLDILPATLVLRASPLAVGHARYPRARWCGASHGLHGRGVDATASARDQIRHSQPIQERSLYVYAAPGTDIPEEIIKKVNQTKEQPLSDRPCQLRQRSWKAPAGTMRRGGGCCDLLRGRSGCLAARVPGRDSGFAATRELC